MNDPRPTILVTGIAGNLGLRLLPLLSDFRIVGVDISPVAGWPEVEVAPLDLGRESSCIQLVQLLQKSRAVAVVHLASVSEPASDGATDHDRSWQVNVAGTARVMEAISEVNRHSGGIRTFIYSSSALVYGPDTEPLVDETAPRGAHTLRDAVQKAETDKVVRFRTGSMGKCSTYLLRPQLFVGENVENHLLDAIRGRVFGGSRWAMRMRRKQKRLSLLLPWGTMYQQKLLQAVHVDDVARLIAWLLRKTPAQEGETMTLNVAGMGAPISMAQCAEIAKIRIRRLPTEWLYTKVLSMLSRFGISAVHPEAIPYLTGSCTISTRRLKALLGGDYAHVIQHSTESALRASFKEEPLSHATHAG